MRIDRARLRDAPALAWVAARAFAAETSRKRVRRRAAAGYPMHLLCTLVLMVQGQLWHWDRKALVGIGQPGRRGYVAAVAAAGTCCAGVLALRSWIPTAGTGQLAVLLLAVALVLVFVVAAMVAALGEFHPARSLSNREAINRWKRDQPGGTFHRISYLAMYPQTGEGFTFARTAIQHAVPPGAGIYAEARSTRHQGIYTRAGLHPLQTRNGTPTLAMGTQTA